MIGQKKLWEKLNKYSYENFPHTILFIGEQGCGKHLLVTELAKKLNFDLVNLTADEKINWTSLQQIVYPTICLIDLAKCSEIDQNKFLKSIEEPSAMIYFCLIATSENNILDTVLNRCVKYYFDFYSVDELKQIYSFTNTEIYNICTTPGLLALIDDETFLRLKTFCHTVIQGAVLDPSYASFLSNTTKINYKEEFNKFDFKLFFKTLLYILIEEQKITTDKTDFNRLYSLYIKTIDFLSLISNKAVNKEQVSLLYFSNIWNLFHGDSLQ